MTFSEKLTALLAEIRELNKKETLTDEDKTAIDAKMSEAEEVRKSIERENRAAEMEKFIATPVNAQPELRAGEVPAVEVGRNRAADKVYSSLGEQILDIRAAQFGEDGAAKERLAND